MVEVRDGESDVVVRAVRRGSGVRVDINRADGAPVAKLDAFGSAPHWHLLVDGRDEVRRLASGDLPHVVAEFLQQLRRHPSAQPGSGADVIDLERLGALVASTLGAVVGQAAP